MICSTIFGLIFIYFLFHYLTKNVRVQDGGKYIRSGQLSIKNFEKLVVKHGVRSVVNFRGDNAEEQAVCEKLGIKYYSIGLSAKSIPSRKRLLQMVDVLENAERPIYAHCYGGSDRSGQFSALYHLECMGESKAKALWQLSPLYLHIPMAYPSKRYFVKEVYKGIEWAKSKYLGLLEEE